MSKTAKGECPRCGSELVVEFWKETYSHGALSSGSVYDRDIVEMTCNHQPDMFTEDEMDDLFHEAAEELAQSKEDYYAEQVDHLKDEGKL